MEDLFWKNLPDRKLKPQMRKVICDYLDELEFNGQIISEIKDKKSLHIKIADQLQELKVGGWINLQPFHKKKEDYRMFKALVDATTYELKVRSNSKEPSNIGITPSGP